MELKTLNSCLYETNIMHCRLRPKRHRFMHKIFMFYLDLDELDAIPDCVRLVSRNRPNFYVFRDDDHFAPDGKSIKEKVRAFLKARGVEVDGKIMLLTNLRTFGHLFNPVSFYYCFDRQGRPVCVVPEIGNTFGEIKPFLLERFSFNGSAFVARETKYYYISPFMEMDAVMAFNLPIPDDRLNVQIDDFDKDGKLLYATMSGRRKELTTLNLWLYTLKFPFVTLKVIGLIHFHAFLLWLKKIPYFNKEDNPHLQKEVYRAWEGHKTHLAKSHH